MFALSTGFCKQFARREYCRFLSNKILPGLLPSDVDVFEGDELGTGRNDHTRKEVTIATKYLLEEKSRNQSEIQWERVYEKLLKEDIKQPSTKIFQACLRLNEIKAGMNHYDYLMKKGKKLSTIESLFFSKLLGQDENLVKKNEKLLIELYDTVKDLMQGSNFVQMFFWNVFLNIPACFYDMVKFSENISTGPLSGLVKKAIEMDEYDMAMKLTHEENFVPPSEFWITFIKFCIRKAEKGEFKFKYINDLVELCFRKNAALPASFVENHLKPFVVTLNKCDKTFNWSIHNCEINSTDSVCSNCSLALLPRNISKKDFNQLKSEFYKKAFADDKMFLNSSANELKNFSKFLQKNQSYDIVIDGLNLMYRKKFSTTSYSSNVLRFFLDKGFRILYIARIHSRRTCEKIHGLVPKQQRDKIQFFLTENLSDDDLFVLYAAMHRGLKTYFTTGDHLGPYVFRLSQVNQTLFMKWQISHQYIIQSDLQLSHPKPHCGLSQLTYRSKEKDKFIWHLSHTKGKVGKVTCPTTLDWVCLQAVRK